MAQTLKEYLDEKLKPNDLRAPDRNPLIAPQADLAKKVKALLNKYETKKVGKIDSTWNKYGAGMSIGDLLFGESPELLDDMSYGKNPLTSGGRTGRIPIPDKRLLDMPIPIPSTGGMGVIKKEGQNWLTGSVERALKELKQYAPAPDPRYTGYDAEHAVNSWIDGPLTKYIKNRMATPSDEVRKLADQGILHFKPDESDVLKESADRARSFENMQQMATSPLGKAWENITDTQMWPRPVSHMSSAQINKDPWISKLDPETGKINSFPTNPGQFGYDHLIDELLNATNPESKFPQHLRMKPEGFKGLTMEEAVKKVHGINQHRALQAEAARKKMSMAEGIPETKRYDDGFRFVAPEDVTKNPKHREYVVDAGKRASWCTQGAACDRYAGRNSRVHILLDDFGNPHAQIAVEKDNSKRSPYEFYANLKSKDQWGLDERVKANNEDLESAIVNSPEYAAYLNAPLEKITEIKPLGNSWDHEKVQELMAKDPDYQKKIQEKLQDFVKSGNWSDVGDLDMAGLYKKSNLTPEEQLLVDSDYLTMDEISKLREGKDWKPLDTAEDW